MSTTQVNNVTSLPEPPSGPGTNGHTSNGKTATPSARPAFVFQQGWYHNIPVVLLELLQWVCWRFDFRNGKWTKVLFMPRKPFNEGKGRPAYKAAKSNDPATWGRFEDAVNLQLGSKSFLDGVGFVFSADDPFVGWDLDNCLNEDGTLMDWARPYLDRLGGTYYEISPSGRGLKGIVRGKLSGTGAKKNGLGPNKNGAIELYDRGRFFTITGNRHPDATAEINDRSEGVTAIYDEIKTKKPTSTRPTSPRTGAVKVGHSGNGSVDVSTKQYLDNLTDEELLRWARNAKNGQKFTALFTAGDTTGYPSASEADAALLVMLAFWTGEDASRMDRLFLQSPLGRRDKCERADYRQRSIASAIALNNGAAPDPNHAYSEEEKAARAEFGHYVNGTARPEFEELTEEEKAIARKEADARARAQRMPVEVTTLWHEVLGETVAIIATNPDIYYRGDSLVTISAETQDDVKLTKATTLRKAAGSRRILVLSDAVVGCYLTQSIEFYRESSDKEGEPITVDVRPPDWLIKAVASLKHWPGMRPLLGISDCPFIRDDGSLVETPGYDEKTGTYYSPSTEYPPVPENPSQDDAKAAWERLKKPFAQFPLQTDNDLAVVLAGLLGANIRPAFPAPIPGIAFIGNKASTGKGLLADSISIISQGHVASTTPYPADPIEAGKVITAIRISGKNIIHFDNLDEGSTYGNPAIDSAMTSFTGDARILGQSKMTGDIDCRTLFMASGNNICPAKDAYRRWLPCNLFTPLERPEERADIKIADLRAYLLEHRATFVVDMLTILRSHALAGWPKCNPAPLASFEQWDRVVRGAVHFCGAGDCCATRRAVADEAPARLAKIALLEGWLKLAGQKATAGEAIKAVTESPASYLTLHNAFMHYGRDGKLVTARSLGNIIRGLKGNLIAGMMFEHAGTEHQAIVWKVVNTNPSSPEDQKSGDSSHTGGESGESGESCLNPRTRDLRTDHNVTTYGDVTEACLEERERHSPDSPDSPMKPPLTGSVTDPECAHLDFDRGVR